VVTTAATEFGRVVHLDPAALRCPYPAFDRLREEAPVTFIADIDSWVVSRFDDIVHVGRHPELFSSALPTGPVLARQQSAAFKVLVTEEPALVARLASARAGSRVLLNADPPEHARQRKIVNRAFTPPKVQALQPRIRAVAHGLVDGFAGRGEVELVAEYAVPLPLTIIAECLGVDEADLPMFKRWSDDFVAGIGNHEMGTDQLRSLLVSQDEFYAYFGARIEERRAAPREDLISDVVHATLDGRPLEDHEMLGMFTQFLVAGNETTTKLIASGVRLLLEQPALLASVRQGPSALAGLIEEVLRIEPPVQGLYRTATTATEVGGVAIPAGAHLLLLYAAGNRDEQRFPVPDAVDPARTNTMQHLAFGRGEHYCLGAALARAEGRIALEVLLERLPELRLAPGVDPDQLEYEPSYVLHGLRRLPLAFTAAAR
jgi:cytochrome P450